MFEDALRISRAQERLVSSNIRIAVRHFWKNNKSRVPEELLVPLQSVVWEDQCQTHKEIHDHLRIRNEVQLLEATQTQ